MEGILLDTMFDLPSLEGVEEVVISKQVVEGTARPLYIYADRSDRTGDASAPNDEKCSLPAASPLRMLEARSGSRLADGPAMTIYTETSDKGFQFTDFRLKDRRAMRSRPAISTRRMIGLTDGHPSFVLQTPSPRPSR